MSDWIGSRCDLCEQVGQELYPADPARGLLRHARCAACGLVFVDPRPTDAAARNEVLYGEPAAPGPGPGERERDARHDARLRALRRRAGPQARVLDVGCGQGAFLGRARRLGLLAEGLDLSPTRARAAAARAEVPVHAGPLESLPARPGFDLIRLHQVLEHTASPRALLAAARARLAPGGEIELATPNAAALAHRALGPAWRQLGRAHNGHLVLVDPRTLARLAAAAGLRVLALRTRGARAWSLTRTGAARRAWRLLELGLEPWVRLRGLGSTLEARLTASE